MRREASLNKIAQRKIEADITRAWALFYVDGDPVTFNNRLELPEAFTLHELRAIRQLELVTLADGRRGVEGDQ